jgi:hypothetical protein
MRQRVFRTLFPAVPGDRLLTAGILAGSHRFTPAFQVLGARAPLSNNSVGTAAEQQAEQQDSSERNSRLAAVPRGTAAPDGEDYST